MMGGTAPLRSGGDRWLAASASGALGVCGVLALAGAAAGDPVALAAAAGLGLAGLGVLLAAGWLDALLILLVTLPLPALYASETVRVSPVLPVSALVVGAWLLGGGKIMAGGRGADTSARALAALFGAVAVASLFAESPLFAARELVGFGLLLGIFVLTVDQVVRRPERARAVARLLAMVSAAAGGAAALEAVGVLPGRFPLTGSGLMRATGGFGWPNELGMFLAITLPFAVHEVRQATTTGGRALALAGMCLVGLGLLATFSRGSWLATAVAPLALVVAGEWRLAMRLWGMGLVAVLGFDLLSGGAVSTRVASTGSDVLVAQRLLLMMAGLLMFQAHPVVGVGPGGFGDALDRFGLQVSGLFDFVGSAHNGYVHMAAEAGVLGLGALLYFVVSTARGMARGLPLPREGRPEPHPARALRVTFFWSFVTACVVSLFEWPFAHGIGELIVMVAGAGLALAAPERGAR